MNPFRHTLLCCTLLFLTLKELTEACSCASSHPQQLFCGADIVCRAKVIDEKTISSSEDSMDGIIRYELKVSKIYKGYETMEDIRYVYTPSQSSLCGAKLKFKEYLLGGNIHEGKVRINLCGLGIVWENVTEFQKESLSQPHMGYEKGCECKIKTCGTESYNNLAPNECPWEEEMAETLNTQHVCIKKSNGSCSWYPSLPVKSTRNSHP